MSTLAWHKGDQIPALFLQLQDDSGTPFVLTDATVTMEVRKPEGDVVTFDMEITDAATGKVTYEWGADDLDQVGIYDALFIITWVGGNQTVPAPGFFSWVVEDRLT